MSIFISIASYRDPELVRTITSAIDNASNPDQLYFGVVLQEFDKFAPDLSFVKNLALTIKSSFSFFVEKSCLGM